MKHPKLNRGYILVMSVLFIGAITLSTAGSLLLLSWAAEQNGQTYMQTAQALELARSCGEMAITNLRNTPGYAGNETYVFPSYAGSCDISTIQGTLPGSLTICTTGTTSTNKRRVKIVLTQLYPTLRISNYQDVSLTSECGGAAALSSSSTASSDSSSSVSSVAMASSAASSIASSAASSQSSSSAVASSAASSISSIASNCGNSVCEAPTEQCDLGAASNGVPGSGCTSTCQQDTGCSCGCTGATSSGGRAPVADSCICSIFAN